MRKKPSWIIPDYIARLPVDGFDMENPMFQLIWIENRWTPHVNLHSDLGRWRSDSVVEVFEGKHVAGNEAKRKVVLFHWSDHYRRMLDACEGHIPLNKLPSESEILERLA